MQGKNQNPLFRTYIKLKILFRILCNEKYDSSDETIYLFRERTHGL